MKGIKMKFDMKNINITEEIILDEDKKHLIPFINDYFKNPEIKSKEISEKYGFYQSSLYQNIPRLKLGPCYKCGNGTIIGLRFNRKEIKKYGCNSCLHEYSDSRRDVCKCKYCKTEREEEYNARQLHNKSMEDRKTKVIQDIYNVFPGYKKIISGHDDNGYISEVFMNKGKFYHIYEVYDEYNCCSYIDFCDISFQKAYELFENRFEYLSYDGISPESILEDKMEFYRIKERFFSKHKEEEKTILTEDQEILLHAYQIKNKLESKMKALNHLLSRV